MIALLFLLAQDVAALDPDERAAAQTGIEKPKDRGALLKQLSDPEQAAVAAEMLALTGGSDAKELYALLEGDDLRAAFAAARALKPSNKLVALSQKSVVAAYALEHRKRGDLWGYLYSQVGKSEAAIVAIANLPYAPGEIRKDWDENGSERAAELKKLFLEGKMSGPVRAVLGNLLMRSGVFSYGDVATRIFDANEDIRAWARKRKVLRRSVLLNEAAKQEKDEFTVSIIGEWPKNRVPVMDSDIVKAIDDGVAWLKAEQQKDGSWKYCACGFKAYGLVDHTAGTTALSVYTLLKCDVPVDDRAVAKGIEYLLAISPDKLTNAQVYTSSLMCLVFSEALHLKSKIARLKDKLRECAAYLIEAQVKVKKGGYEQGPWSYAKGTTTGMDNSNTQFAMMGLLAAQNQGVGIPAAVWQRALAWWQAVQMEDGGWPYVFQAEQRKTGTNSMSAAGLYCFLISRGVLQKKDPKTFVDDRPSADCFGRMKKTYPVPAPARDRGIGHVFSVYYDLYSLERAMMISGTQLLDGKDWYHDGALYILYNQLGTGEWLDVTDTCFALLFLKKAYVAVASGDK